MPSVCGSSQAVVADQRLGVGLRQPAARILAASEPLQHRPSFRLERTVSAITQFDGLVFKAFEGHACSG